MNDVARIYAVAEGLRHLLTVTILNHRVDEHMLEGQALQEVSIEHHHARHPQRDDLARCAEHGTWIESIEQTIHVIPRGRIWPTERRHWPQRRTKPRIEHIWIAFEPARLQQLRVTVIKQAHEHDAFVLRRSKRRQCEFSTINHTRRAHTRSRSLQRREEPEMRRERCARSSHAPHRNLMTPPKLSRDAPVSNVLMPSLKGLCVTSWEKLQSTIALHRGRGKNIS